MKRTSPRIRQECFAPADATNYFRMRRRVVAGLACLLVIPSSRAQPPDPSRTLTLIVPTAPGVAGDQLARIVVEALSRILESPVHVENIAGDSGVSGTNAIAAAARDGTVIGLGISSAMVGGRLLSRSAKFNPIEDFQWFTILGNYPAAMVIPANASQSDIATWVASAREAPMPLTYASVGTGSAGHLAGGFLRMAQGARLIHRAVEAPDERYALLADGRIAALFDDVPNARTAAPRSGNRIIAVTSATRVPVLPDVPSFGELWNQPFDTWVGLVGPKGLDNAAYYRLASSVGVLLGDSVFLDSMRAAGVTFMGLSGRAALAFLDSEILRNAKEIALLNQDGMR
jgi:tripartite-type tricarboxylate transporter receptor subunit TctC